MIRTLKYLGIVVLLALAACNSHEKEYEKADAVLQEAERLYQHPQGERADYPGADTVQISQELADAAEFFVKRNDFGKAAVASLYCGYAQKEDDDKILATKYFKDAEQYGTTAGDSLTTARAQYNIARMLFEDYEEEEMLAMAKKADLNFGNHDDERAYVYMIMAIPFITYAKYEEAGFYLKKSLDLAEKANSVKIKCKILQNYSVYYRCQNKYDEAINYLRQKKQIETDSVDILMTYNNMSYFYRYIGQYDSAFFYAKKALNISETVKVKKETIVAIYGSLYQIAKMQGDYQSALAYNEKYLLLQDEVMQSMSKKTIYGIQRQYDYEVLQNNLNKKIIGRQRIILIISLLLLLVSIVMIVSLVRQKNILKENREIKQELDKTKDELQKSMRPEVVEEELSRQLHLIITANRIGEHANDFKKEWAPLVRKINNEKDSMFEGAMAAVERVYPDMYSTILQKYPNLNDTESKVLLLSCSDLTNTEIGYILGLSVHSVNKSRSEIRRKIVV